MLETAGVVLHPFLAAFQISLCVAHAVACLDLCSLWKCVSGPCHSLSARGQIHFSHRCVMYYDVVVTRRYCI